MGGRGQADDQDTGLLRSPARHRPAQYRSELKARRLVAATSSRQLTSRGQARHTDCRAASSASDPAAAASERTCAGVRATGVAPVAGSPGQPVPGGTGSVGTGPAVLPAGPGSARAGGDAGGEPRHGGRDG